MSKIITFYMDDSGTRHPDHNPGKRASHGYDWFALGGILVEEEDEQEARFLHGQFCEKWNIVSPIHSVEVRGRTAGFSWIAKLSEAGQREFYESLYQLIKDIPVVGLACVIDRPGYNHKYFHKYGRQRWSLCKSAFHISVERGAKHANSLGYRLRVSPERCNKTEDHVLKGYFEELKKAGAPFDISRSEKYRPLSAKQLSETLYEFKPKAKSSPMAQFADLYLWPICMGGYHPGNRPYQRLMSDGKLIECRVLPEHYPMLATKYYCFDLVERKQ